MSTIWLNQEALASPLVTAFIDQFGLEVDPTTGKSPLDWYPTTVRAELMELSHGKHIPQPVMDRLMAGLFVIRSNQFYTSLPDFIEMANVLSGSSYNPSLFDPADCNECLWAIAEASLLNGADEKYSTDVAAYVSQMFVHEGFAKVPYPADAVAIAGGWSEPVARYSGDDAMFGAVQSVQADRYRDTQTWFNNRMRLCESQFESLTLRNGKKPQRDVFQAFIKEV